MDLRAGAGAARRIADNPAHGVAGGDGTRADKLLARLQRNVGDFFGGGIDFVQRTLRERINLDGIDIIVADWLDPGRRVRRRHASRWVRQFRLRNTAGRYFF